MPSHPKIFLDFEFSGIVERNVKLVSCVTYDQTTNTTEKFWLHKRPMAQRDLVEHLKSYKHIVAYSAIAEQRSFIALGLDPLEWEWEDLFLEYRLITNHNDSMNWGNQLVDGKVKYVRKPKPKWERTDADKATGFKPTHSLAEATYKLTEEIRDTAHKTATRNLIISYPDKFTEVQKNQILGYNEEDVKFLPRIRDAIRKEFQRLLPKYQMEQYESEAKWRGRYAAHTAWMETNGYPVDLEATKNFARQVPNIIFDMQREINGLFPDIKPFRFNKKDSTFSWNQLATKSWIKECHDTSKWTKTDGGDLSLSLEAFEKFYPFKHDYPLDNFGAQLVRFLKLKQSLYGFSQGQSARKSFWDNVGSDGAVRPYMNIYGAQSSRSQPGATGFMFLKPAWMRALVQPPEGEAMAGIDYGSQEFFIAALMADDRNMIESYLSGDVYLAFGKLSGQIPKDGTKETHKRQRDLCKSTVLGISYLMTKYGLSAKLTSDSGEVWTEERAQEQIDLFYETYENLQEMQQDLMEDYEDGMRPVRLPDGWIMFGDNENIRSVVNVPVQGRGATIMRKAVDLYHEATGDHVVKTLHDALYIRYDVGDEWKILALKWAMREAFAYYFPKHTQTARRIKLDPFAWSPNYEADGEIKVTWKKEAWTVPVSNLYVDDRAIADYKKFSKYFEKPDFDSL